jgi:hypothetical protein
MLTFLVGHRADGRADHERAAGVLRAIVAATPFAAHMRVRAWSGPDAAVALAWAVHDQSALGTVEQAACEERRAALVAGRPIRWRAGGDAEGRDAASAAAHLDGIPDGLDGRFAIVRADGSTLEVRTDVLGAYPVYATTGEDGTWWASGLVGALVPLTADPRTDERVAASVVACGWSLDGQPAVRGVRRLPRGATVRVERDGRRVVVPAAERQKPVALLGRPQDPEGAARDLVASLLALADWPGRPNAVPVTGGRDSRVILAAALASGLQFEALTAGGPGDADVQIARQLCAAAGIPHRLFAPRSGRWLGTDPETAAALVQLRGATTSLSDGAGFPVRFDPGPLPLWHSGQGGEIARGYYGRGRGPRPIVRAALAAQLSGWRPWRPLPLRRGARAHVHAVLREWAREWGARGAATAILPQLAYLDLRMGFWAGPSHGAVEWVRDTTSPLWSWKLLPALLAGSYEERHAETLQRRIVDLLAPQLGVLPFDDGTSWPAASAGAPVPGAARSRPPAPLPPIEPDPAIPATPPRPFAHIQSLALSGLRATQAAPVAALLDTQRTRRLLTAPEPDLDWRQRSWVWNILTVTATVTGTGVGDQPGPSPAADDRSPDRSAPTLESPRLPADDGV